MLVNNYFSSTKASVFYGGSGVYAPEIGKSSKISMNFVNKGY